MKKISSSISILFFCTLFAWGVLSFGRTLYNVSKLFTEEKSWIFLSDDAKRERIFGDRYKVIQFIKENTSPSSSLQIEMNEKDVYDEFYFLNIYYLFPRRVRNVRTITHDVVMKGKTFVIVGTNLSKKHSPQQKIGKYSVFLNKE